MVADTCYLGVREAEAGESFPEAILDGTVRLCLKREWKGRNEEKIHQAHIPE